MKVPFDAITPVPGPDEREKAKARTQGRHERQERTAALRRQHLLDVAWALWVEVGPQSFNLRDLGARAGYTAGALYSYFPSRDHLISELRGRLLNAVAERVDRAFKQGTKAGAADLSASEAKTGQGEPVAANDHHDVFDRCTLAWWQALAKEPNALTLLLHGQGARAAALQGAASEAGQRDLLAELSQATQPCLLALEETGLAASAASAIQQQSLCLGVGLLVMQQSSLSAPVARKTASLRFVNAVRVFRAKTAGEENGAFRESVEAKSAQVDLF